VQRVGAPRVESQDERSPAAADPLLEPHRIGSCPAERSVFVIQGAEDFTTPTSLANAFVESIHAPSKAFIPIVGGGHFAVFMKSEAFLHALASRVFPLVKER
jgi:pimeloyl-ACP methyl ester carboxylesterase